VAVTLEGQLDRGGWGAWGRIVLIRCVHSECWAQEELFLRLHVVENVSSTGRVLQELTRSSDSGLGVLVMHSEVQARLWAPSPEVSSYELSMSSTLCQPSELAYEGWWALSEWYSSSPPLIGNLLIGVCWHAFSSCRRERITQSNKLYIHSWELRGPRIWKNQYTPRLSDYNLLLRPTAERGKAFI
jgi:hypothetical protein